jgi:hypothetical protein
MSTANCLLVIAALSAPAAAPPSRPVPASPRLEAIRPHLCAGVKYAELVKKVGQPDLQLGRGVLRPVYVLDGKYRGMWLELTFDGDRLRGAQVIDLGAGKIVQQVGALPKR